MRIILSPAKRMKADTDSVEPAGMPRYIEQTASILSWLRELPQEELKNLWKCNDKIAGQNFKRISDMDLKCSLTPAVLAYEGIAYQYMAPAVFEEVQYAYLQEHLRILSAFYGVLKPMDGVTPYRLEMQAKASVCGYKNLYELWGSRLYEAVRDESGVIVNLASREYSKCIEKYLKEKDRFITIIFCENAEGRLVTKGTYAKMARGDMVRFMAEEQIQDPRKLRDYNRLGYVFRSALSTDTEYVFERVTI
ncbi:MAG: peroxide stress protein YaaA [Lachnospiraceae bacterium]|jgi:cytoplasmic iron level regulating protein YaaA (DUF328/UPF0246 family)|nr:peroxide stress protein YaaA [Lachnospiraceae bacterium]